MRRLKYGLYGEELDDGETEQQWQLPIKKITKEEALEMYPKNEKKLERGRG